MLTYNELKNNPSKFLSLTSLEVEEFDALLPSFKQAWDADVAKRIASKPRQRKPGGGRKATLKSLEDKLLFILVYVKVYPLQEVQGELFGISQGQTNGWIQRLTPLLQSALAQEDLLPERAPSKLEEVLSGYDLLEFTIDGTERRRQRPTDAVEQQEYYSGKKKTHTLINNLIAHPSSRTVCYLSNTYPGKRHDKRICDEEGYVFPRLAELSQDTGFQGFRPEDVIIYQPKKKPRGAPLAVEDRFINSVISSVRIIVENIICGVKRCRILKDIFRNHLTGFDDTVMEIACGLHNLRVRHRHHPQFVDLIELAANPYFK
jgi:hypothetical protein